MTEHPRPEPSPEAVRRALRQAALLTAGAGIAFGVLTIVAWVLLSDDREALLQGGAAQAYHEGGGLLGTEIAGLYLLPFAAILFLWFSVALRGWIRGTQQRRNLLISDLQLVTGVVFTALFLVGAAAIATSVVVAQTDGGRVSIESLRALSGFGNTLMTVMGVRIAAVFVIATASLGLSTAALPRWFNLLSYGFGAILILTPIVAAALIVAFPIWVIVLSVMMLFHLANVPDDAILGFAARYAARLTEGEGADARER